MLFDQPENRRGTRESPETMRLVPFERYRSAIRWQFLRGVLIGMLLSAVVAIPAFEYSKMRRDGTSLPKASGKTALGTSDAPAGSRAPKETAVGYSPVAIQPKPQALKLAPLTDASFTKPEPTKKTLRTLAQLWASFETGDTKAAVALADIYLRGEGIPVNCEQARVLLFVASKQNSAEATRKLQDLDAAGCPAP